MALRDVTRRTAFYSSQLGKPQGTEETVKAVGERAPNTVYRLGQKQDKALNKVVAASQDKPITTGIGHPINIWMKDDD